MSTAHTGEDNGAYARPCQGEAEGVASDSWFFLCSVLYIDGEKQEEPGARQKTRRQLVIRGRWQAEQSPRQDEDGQDTIGSANREVGPADGNSPEQGISNRPAKDEHAFAADTSEFVRLLHAVKAVVTRRAVDTPMKTLDGL